VATEIDFSGVVAAKNAGKTTTVMINISMYKSIVRAIRRRLTEKIQKSLKLGKRLKVIKKLGIHLAPHHGTKWRQVVS